MREDCGIDGKPVAFLLLEDLQPGVEKAVSGED
jgi:hypothetical protein